MITHNRYFNKDNICEISFNTQFKKEYEDSIEFEGEIYIIVEDEVFINKNSKIFYYPPERDIHEVSNELIRLNFSKGKKSNRKIELLKKEQEVIKKYMKLKSCKVRSIIRYYHSTCVEIDMNDGKTRELSIFEWEEVIEKGQTGGDDSPFGDITIEKVLEEININKMEIKI